MVKDKGILRCWITNRSPGRSVDCLLRLCLNNVTQGNPAHGKWLCLSLTVTKFWNRMGNGIKEVWIWHFHSLTTYHAFLLGSQCSKSLLPVPLFVKSLQRNSEARIKATRHRKLWWRVYTQIWIVLIIWKFASSNQKHCPDLGSVASLAWNFCAVCSDIISWRKPVMASQIGCCFLRLLVQSCNYVSQSMDNNFSC